MRSITTRLLIFVLKKIYSFIALDFLQSYKFTSRYLPILPLKLSIGNPIHTFINGEDIKYTITATHIDGYAPVEYIIITDKIPPQITYPPKVTIAKSEDAGIDIGNIGSRIITIKVLRLPDAAGNKQIIIKIKGKIKV